MLVNAINTQLGSYGTTIDIDNPSHQFAGNEADFVNCLNDMKNGQVDAVFFLNANPVYDYYEPQAVKDALKKVRLKVSFANYTDETASHCDIIAPNNYYLESWGDDQPIEGYYTVIQPAINPVYDTRQAEHSFLIWSENPVKDYYTYVRNNWDKNLLAKGGLSGISGWETLLQTGFVKATPKPAGKYTFTQDTGKIAQTISNQSSQIAGSNQTELSLYQTVAMRDGKRANNPWLQELPDPVTKVTWDNYATMSPNDMKAKGLEDGNIINIKSGVYSIDLPVINQPGQASGTISVAVGYGRTMVGPVGINVGKNAFPFLTPRKRYFPGFGQAVDIKPTGDTYALAQTQTHHSIEGRNSIIKEATFKEYLKESLRHKQGKEEGHKRVRPFLAEI